MRHIFVIASALCWLSCESATTLYEGLAVADKEAYELPALPFEKNALEPYIDEATVVAHHEGHVNNYRKKTNDILASWRQKYDGSQPAEPGSEFETTEDTNNVLSEKSLVDILRNVNSVPKEFRQPVINNVGGFANHLIYWSGMSPNPGGEERKPTGKLLTDINKSFGSLETLKEKFTQKALLLFGSGYVWLCRPRGTSDQLTVIQTHNQDSAISLRLDPVLVLDVWEHAYYLKHQFRRAAHIDDWWKLVDWERAAEMDDWWRSSDVNKHDEF